MKIVNNLLLISIIQMIVISNNQINEVFIVDRILSFLLCIFDTRANFPYFISIPVFLSCIPTKTLEDCGSLRRLNYGWKLA